MSAAQYRGRIAPTPSGLLHMGHAETFRTAWARARERGGEIILRMEDIDADRCKKEYADAALRDIKAVGLDWDEGPDVGGPFAPYTQSERFAYYWDCVKKLIAKKAVYPSNASRAEIKKFGRPSECRLAGCEPEAVFPEKLRENCCDLNEIGEPQKTVWRFKVPDGERVEFCDNKLGPQSFTAGKDFGDFVVWRKEGAPSYELAVVADDAAMHITEVVRGRDLLLSTARQILLYNALGLQPPQFYHCELVLNEGGEKISKSSLSKADANQWLICNRRKRGL